MKRISLLFYIRKIKMSTDGLVPIYIRITVAEVRFELATKRYVDLNKWNPMAHKVIGSSEDIKHINSYLKGLEQEIYSAHQLLVQQGKTITAEELKMQLTGKKEPARMLIQAFRDHNDQVKELVG